MAHAYSDTDSDASTYDPTQNDESKKDLTVLGVSKSRSSADNKILSVQKCTSFLREVSDSDTGSVDLFPDDMDEARNESSPLKPESPKKLCRSDTLELQPKIAMILPSCKYGLMCYRKNPSHFKEFNHPEFNVSSARKRKADDTAASTSSTVKQSKRTNATLPENGFEVIQLSAPFNFCLTKAKGVSAEHNNHNAVNLKDILDVSMGDLQKSAQFSYIFEIPWLLEQYPVQFRKKPMLLIHGFQRQQKAQIERDASSYDNIKLCQAKLDIPYGTHHTKMILLLYPEGMRVVIHTANLTERDWSQKTQGAWISPVFPKLSKASSTNGESRTNFKHDLLEYMRAYNARPLDEWIDIIKQHDMSQAKVYIIGSIPGRYTQERKHSFGHLKLRKILQENGPSTGSVRDWPVIGQFSSIGTLGAQPELWLCGEWYTSLSSAKDGGTSMGGNRDKLKLIFPSKDNVRTSLEGYPAGASIPYSINVAKKQPYLHSFFHLWKAAVRGRSRAAPHIKTYCRMSPDAKQLAWFAVTSANLSKAAWGALEKKGTQFMIRSYEIGVLFLPKHFDVEFFQTLRTQGDNDGGLVFPQPYDLPPVLYSKKDKPWIWDIAHTDLPDSHGNAWCPS